MWKMNSLNIYFISSQEAAAHSEQIQILFFKPYFWSLRYELFVFDILPSGYQ